MPNVALSTQGRSPLHLSAIKPVAATGSASKQAGSPPRQRVVVINVSKLGIWSCGIWIGLFAISVPGLVLSIRRLVTEDDVTRSVFFASMLSSLVFILLAVTSTLGGRHNKAYLATVCFAVVMSGPWEEQPRLACTLLVLAAGAVRLVMAVHALRRWLHRRPEKPSVDKPLQLPFTSVVLKGSKEFASVEQDLERMCAPYAAKYPSFTLQLAGLYKVENSQLDVAFDQRSTESGERGNVKRLVHGTTSDSVTGILAEGFKLPLKSGMFGNGIYFADCPLKSWQYCRDGNGLMMLCDVELGKSRPKRAAAPQLGQNGKKDLRPGWIEWLFSGAQVCDSITAVAVEDGGSVRVPEYVIYSPEQAAPRYVLQFRQRPVRIGSGHPDESASRRKLHQVLAPTGCEIIVGMLIGLCAFALPAVFLALSVFGVVPFGIDVLRLPTGL